MKDIKLPDDVYDAIAEMQQPRSRFQLEHFVLGQHDTDQMRYYQTVIEINGLLHNYKVAEIETKKTQLRIERLRASNDEIDALDADLLELNLNQSQLAMHGAQRELLHLIDLWKSFPTKYTREQIDSNQIEYWTRRLSRQSALQLFGQGSIDWAQMDAMRQIGILEKFMEENPPHQLPVPNKELEDKQ